MTDPSGSTPGAWPRPSSWRVVVGCITVLAVGAAGFVVGRLTAISPIGEQVGPVCSAMADRITDVKLPSSLDDGEQLSAMARAVVAEVDAATREVRRVRVVDDEQEDLDRLLGQLERRRALWQGLGDGPGDLDDELEVYEQVLGTYDGSFTSLGAPGCDRVAVPGSTNGPAVDEARLQWAGELEAVCASSLAELSGLDTAAGGGVLPGPAYVQAVGEVLSDLDEVLTSVPDGAGSWAALSQDRWVRSVSGLAAAAREGDVESARMEAERWALLDSTVPAACHMANAVSATSPSWYLFPPQLDGVPAVGVSGNLVVDAAGAARNLGELLTSPSYGGIDPSFSVPAILAQYPVDGTVTGDVVPDPGQISVDGPSGSVRERPVGVDNPWTVVLAVVDGGGGCSAVVVSGFPRLDQFLEVPGACSARAALG